LEISTNIDIIAIAPTIIFIYSLRK